MKRFYTSVVTAMLTLTIFAQKFATDTIRYNGNPEHFINIVILGDGYLESELNQFSMDALNISNALFKESPFENYQRYFNVFTIKVPSNVTGAALHPDSLIDNYFGSTFGYAGIERLLVPTKTANITNVLANNFPSYDQAFMIVNSSKYGGSGGQVPTASTHSSSSEIAIHEMGHSFTNLADEYWAGSQYAREAINMTQETNTTIVKWKNWLNDFGIGLYPHAESPTWYRPHQNCKMRFLGVPFCAVCTEGNLEKIHTLVSPVIGFNPQNTDITEFSSPLLFKVDLILPNPNTLKSTWELNGLLLENNADSVLLDKNRLTDGLNTLTFYVEDTTHLLRINNHSFIHLSTVSWKIENTITGVEIITNASNEVFIKLYPNPVEENLFIEFKGNSEGRFRVEILDIEGKIQFSQILNDEQQKSIDLKKLPQGIFIARFYVNENVVVTRKFVKTT